jgi:hypothetical protein
MALYTLQNALFHSLLFLSTLSNVYDHIAQIITESKYPIQILHDRTNGAPFRTDKNFLLRGKHDKYSFQRFIYKCCIILVLRELCQQDVQIEIIFETLYFLKRNALLVSVETVIKPFILLYLYYFCCKLKAKRHLGKLMASSTFCKN